MDYKIIEGRDHYNDRPLFRVIGGDYVGEWHDNKADAEAEIAELNGAAEGDTMEAKLKAMIPLGEAIEAHGGTSFSPEKRGASIVAGFVSEMEADRELFDNEADFWRYAEKAAALLRDYLHKHARVVSPMITGPANFPVRRNEKANRSADNALSKYINFREKVRYRKTKPESTAIKTGKTGAADKLREKLEKLEKLQEMMKAANRIVRKKSLSYEEKIKQLSELLGVEHHKAAELLEPDFAGRVGFADFELKNNNANIRRIRQQIEKAERIEKAAKQIGEIKFDGGEIVLNHDEGRVQILFDDIPDEETRSKLKARGFRWSRKNKAWQRQLTANAVVAAKQIVTA